MDIHVSGSRPTRKAPDDYFTGTVWQDPIIATAAPARLVSTRVSFEPGARTAWRINSATAAAITTAPTSMMMKRWRISTASAPNGARVD